MDTDDLELKMTFQRSRSNLRTLQITHPSLGRSTCVHHQCHRTLKPPGTFQTLLTLTLTLALTLQGAQGQFSCQQPGYNEIVAWRTEAGDSNVTWRLDQVCSSTVQCYGPTSQSGNQPLDAQLCPVQLQLGDRLFLLPPPAGSPYTTTVANVTEAAFYTCPSRAYPEDQILRNSDPSRALQIPPRFLLPGVVYLAQHPDGAFSNCNFGLRLQVLIKDQVCRPPTGGGSGTQEELCSGRGMCGSRFLEDRYRCYCFQNYRGAHCTEFDACAAGPCKNGGKCIDGDEGLLASTFLCICAEGFTGPDCTEILGQCAPAVCGNGSCVAVSQAAFRCQCRAGFSGTFCDQFTDMCTPNPCLNQGTCLTQLLTHTCQCRPGFTGPNCETNIDECASSPCAQAATCVDDVNGFYCRCPPGFDRDFCLEPINYCSSSPCENNAECVPIINGYFCNCTLGFQGDRCETIISRCSEVPDVCQHGGHCLQSPDGPVQCQCSPGWTGSTCDKLDNLCRFGPCPNHTVCEDKSTMLQPGAFVCVCPPGYTGDKCQSEIVECTSNPCLNEGVCVDKLDGYSCLCTEAYSGQNCEKNIDMCMDRAALLCQNNATCIDGDANFDYTCVCQPGFSGADCSANTNECESSPCLYSGTCQDRVNGYTCLCADGFSGNNCQVYFDYCNLRPCRNGAQCTPQLGSYTCECTSGWSGTNCTQDVDECQSSPCLNGATCQNLENQYRCICGGDYYGRRCETSFDNCETFSCLNGATCVDLVDDYRCLCQQGYVGRDCGTEVVECLSAPCRNGGICQDLVNGYRCFCDTNLWAGVNCETPLNNCSSSPCFNAATCRPQAPPSDFTCECKPRYTGRLCQTSVALCTSSPCLNSGTCVENVQALNYTCTCAVGYTGSRCESDVDFCLGHNCRNGATCRDGVTSYTCDCPSGFTGQICETNIDGCASSPCKNSAICEDADTDNGYECFCVNGFTGDDCSKEVNECDSSPCVNSGLCLDRVNRFLCVCPLGYEGIRCETNKDDCVNHDCRNGAVCVDGVNGYRCQCRPGYVGSVCSFEIDECLSSPCDSTGSLLCTDQVANYSCLCKAGYTGRNCEREVDECQSNPCRNGATCRNLLNRYQCLCIAGTTGTHCETIIDNCASNPCGIGTCQGSVSDYQCICPSDGRNYDANCQPILPCSSNPCRNQATCVNEGNGYRCLCQNGFTGADCRIADYCKVFNVSCSNGGLCVSVDKNFTCVCNAGYIGRFCETNKDECANHICQNGATCEDRVNSYGCTCRPGFVGRFCEDVATSCVESPCYNGATCVSTPNFAARTLFTCVCVPGYEGSYCEKESEACGSNPCKNGGTCSQRSGAFECVCKAGYAGPTCEQDVDECIGHGCRNGATCVDNINGYTCRCPVGFTGTLCQSEVNECTSSPCQNGGRCIDGVDGYQCFCKNGFTGGNCEVDYDECLSTPCQNQATCVDSAASFRCQCPLGVTGTLCETNIDECSSSPCRHGATCTDLYNGYNCTCTVGYSGAHCETDVDECTSSPCDNGGTCRDRAGRYLCDCVQPFRGLNCNLLPCDLNPCESGGTCYNDLSKLPDGFRCECIKGLSGTRCQSNIDDCVARPDGTVPCSGRGLCLDDVNKYTCLCNPGWKGKDCEVPIDECTNNECRNSATCVNLWTGYRCLCATGYEGQFCERETDECQPQPCKNSATCVDLHNDYRCLCREGWTGKDCDTEVNECILTGANPCRNGATCLDGFATFTCQCAPFYTGTLCESRYDPCGSQNYPCKQEALCTTNQDGSYTCDCPRGYTGTNCEIDVNECASSPCTNGGRCEDRSAGYRCFCPLGFTGNQCELNIDDCLYCKNGATCQDLTNDYVCTCTAGFTGQNCTDDVDECDVTSPCRNGATCNNTVGGYSCICKPGYTGVQCETDVDECVSAPCKNGALCNQGFGDFTCFCRIGYTGKLCDVDIDECASEPCGNGICRDLVNNYTCECLSGWRGTNCLQEVDECASSPCSNGGICIDQVNAFRCVCPAGYTGPQCEIDVEVCQRGGVSQCLNGGTCNEGPGNTFDCICKPGYAGRFCEVDLNECNSFPCKNGATCEDIVDGYLCTCAPGFMGDDCSVDVDECTSSPCMNQGICQETRGGGYECLCLSGLGGVHCEINYNDCLPTMCLNGGTCVDGLNTHTCICPSDTTGRSCETLLFTPTPTLQPSITTAPTTGVVQPSTISIASSSMLSGTVGFSLVEEDSVIFDSRASDSFILRPSETGISVAMETETVVIASMTTIAAPEQMETNSVDSSFYLASVSEIMASDTVILSPSETRISVAMETESPTMYDSSYDLASQSESTPLFSSSPILPSDTADYISETSLPEPEMLLSTSVFSTQLTVLPTLSVSPSNSPNIETEIGFSSNYVATSAIQTVTDVTASPTMSDTPEFVSSSLYTSINSESSLIGTPSATESVSHSLNTSTSISELYLTSEIYTVGISPSVTMDFGVDSSSFTLEIESSSSFSAIISETMITVEVSQTISGTDISAISPTVSNIIDSTAIISVISQSVEPTDIVPTVPGEISTDMLENLTPSMSTSVIQMPHISSSSGIEFMSSSFEMNDLSNITFTESDMFPSVKESVMTTFVLTEVMSVSQTVSFNESSTDVDIIISSSNDLSNTISSLETSQSIFPSIVPTPTSIPGTTIGDETTDSLSLQTQTIEPTTSDSTMLLGSASTVDLIPTRSEVMMSRFFTSLVPTYSIMETEVLSNVPEVSTGLVQPVTQNSMYVSTLSLHPSVTTPLDVHTPTIRISDSDFASPTAIDIVPTTSVSYLQTQTLDTVFASVSMISESESPSESVNSDSLTASPTRVMPDSTTEHLSVMTTYVQSTDLSSSFSSSITSISSIDDSSSDDMSQGFTAVLETSLFESVAGPSIIFSSTTETSSVESTSVEILMNQTSGTPSETLFMSTSLSDEILTTVLPIPDITVTDSVDSTNEVSKPITSRLPEITATDFIDSTDSLELSDSSTVFGETSLLDPSFTDSISNVLATTLHLATSLHLATESVMLSATQVDSSSMSAPVTDQLTGMLLSSSLDIEMLTSIPIEMTSVITESITSVVPSMSPTKSPEIQPTLTLSLGIESLGQSSGFASNSQDLSSNSPLVQESIFSVSSALSVTATIEDSQSSSSLGEIKTQVSTSESVSPLTSSPQPSSTSSLQQGSETTLVSSVSSTASMEIEPSLTLSSSTESLDFMTDSIQTMSASLLPASSSGDSFATTVLTSPGSQSPIISDISQSTGTIVPSDTMISRSDLETIIGSTIGDTELVSPLSPSMSTEPITSESSTLFSGLVPSVSLTLSVPSVQTSLQTDLPSQSPTTQDAMRTTIGESLLPSFSALPGSSTSVLVEPTPMTQTIQGSLLSSAPVDSEETEVVDATLITKSIIDNTLLTSLESNPVGTLLTTSVPVINTVTSMMAPSSSLSIGQTSSARESVLPESVSTVSKSLLPTITSTMSNPPADTSITVPAPSTTDGGLPVDQTMTHTAIVSVQPSQTTMPATSVSMATSIVIVLPTKAITSSPSLAPTTISPSPTMSVGPTTTVVVMTTAKPTPEPTSCGDVSVPCYNNASCVDVTLGNGTDTFVCLCPEKYTGKRCDKPIIFDPLKFTGSSLLTFDPIPLRSQNAIKLTLRTYQSNGVIFYSAKDYSVLDSTHYIRLAIKDGYLVYQFSCIFEKFNLESNVKVDTGELFNITIRQTEDCKAELEVDWTGNSTTVEIGAPFVFPSLYLKTLSTFYVGGIPDNVTYVPGAAPNFAGCIGVININGARYGFFEAREAVNIAECGVTVPTLTPPGTTINPSPLPSCDDVTCQNGGTCRDVLPSSGRSRYQCDCPLHFIGVHCEQEIGISFPEFSGQSFLKHANLELSGRPSNELYLTFRTASLNGTLLYASSTGGEFVHLFVDGGYLKYQASCGPSNVLFVDTRMLVNHNNLTAVNIRQTMDEDGDCTVTVTVNDDVQTTVTLSLAPPRRGHMYDLGPLYLGGLPPDVTPDPRANPFINFIGCIRHLQINGEERLVFQDAVDGRNIAECDVPPCQYTPCYNNATCLPSVDGYTCECLPSYSGALCERTACDRNPCQHGGTCLHQLDTATYTCLCPYGRHGLNCERALTITRPEYYGTQLGYISFTAFPRPLGLDYTFDVQFTFTLTDRTHTGLMLFAGQEAANPKYGADFFAVGIQDGYVHFQFNLGSGIAHLRSQLPVNSLRPTHQVLFGRDRQRGYLKLDGEPNVTGSAGGGLQGLNIFSHLYVGGYDNYNLALPSDVIFRDGFKGCLFDVELRTGTNGHWTSPGDVMTGRNVGQCHLSECDVTECRNGATCINLGATYRCECTEGWKGPTCSDVITPCDGNHQCTEGATCLPLVSGGYTCHCPLGKAGTLCEQNIVISDARFVGETSYMGFTHKGSLRFAIDIRLQFKPEVTTGLLFYIAEHLSMRSGDFLSLVLQDGGVQLRYRVGTSPTVVVTSQNKVSTTLGVWYVVEAGRNTTHGYVTLGGRTTSVKVTGQMVGLDVTTPIYVGGVRDLGTLAPSAVQDEPSAFEGCVRELVVNKHSYQLTEKGASTGVNVVDCDGTSCGYQVCQNGGTCYPQTNSGFVCGCTPDYYGFICETSVLCRNNPCVGGATCIPEVANATYRCICPLGRRGARCDEEFTFTSARFTGDSYILYQDPNYNDSDVTKTYMSFNFSTIAYNGLIVWNGEAYSDKDDYLGVGIHNGHARVVISLGWWTREDVITDEIVSDGGWHSIIIQRSDRRVRVYVDGKMYDVTLAGQFGGLNTGGGYYFGGFEFDKITRDETCSHFDSSFVGCLRDVYLRLDGEPLNLLNKASSGANVLSCDDR